MRTLRDDSDSDCLDSRYDLHRYAKTPLLHGVELVEERGFRSVQAQRLQNLVRVIFVTRNQSSESSAQWNESPQAQDPPALGLSMVKPCFEMESSKSIFAPSR